MRRAAGFTLIEVTIALAIAAVLFAAVVMGVGALTGSKAKEASTELAGVIRTLYDTSALTGRTCRLVFELPKKRDDDGETTWRAECAKGAITAAAKRDDALREANLKDKGKGGPSDSRFERLTSDSQPTTQELMLREKSRVEELAKFSDFSTDDMQPKSLPSGVKLEVWTHKQRDRVEEGTAYLYFFPQGFTERAHVYVKQGTHVWTLTVAPLTGKTVIHSTEIEVPRS